MHGTVNLVRMDFLKLFIQGKTLLLYTVLMACFLFSPVMIPVAYFGFLYLSVHTVAALDEQSKGEFLSASLPVSRSQQVQGKYLFSLLVLTALSLLCAVLGRVGAWAGLLGRELDIVQILPTLFLFGSIFLGLTLPLVLYLGAIRSRYWILGLYLLFFSAGGGLVSVMEERGLVWVELVSGTVFPIVCGTACLLVSYLAAVLLYRKKQFTD